MSTALARFRPSIWTTLSVVAALVGLVLMTHSAFRSSATYDEVAYFKVGCRWWRTGDQERITRMGSPQAFWKFQQVPALLVLDGAGRGAWIDDPERFQSRLLPILRLGSSWIWLSALALTAGWARQLHGPKAMALASWLFALGPNLRAHGGLITMEMPLIATTAGVGWLATNFLRRNDRKKFVVLAVASGLAFSCKFTAVLIPPIFAACWLLADVRGSGATIGTSLRKIVPAMFVFVVLMMATDWAVSGFATLPMSERTGKHPSLFSSGRWLARLVEIPVPSDWVGFLIQARHQRSGGPSYLLGERRMQGWWYYYLVAMAVKVPPAIWFLVLVRAVSARRADVLIPASACLFLLAASLGSGRNYGVRYLLPAAPFLIVWISALAQGRGREILAVGIGLAGLVATAAGAHPRELSYFPAFVGGPRGGRAILADSNLDWGQGLRELATFQENRPECRDLSLYYFGDTRPSHYGVVGEVFVIDASTSHPDLPSRFDPLRTFVAVSSSLQFGPWGPEGYFRRLKGVEPIAILPDATIAIYRTNDLKGAAEAQ